MGMKMCDPDKYIVWVDYRTEGWSMSHEMDALADVFEFLTGDQVSGRDFVITQAVPVALEREFRPGI